MEIQWKAPPTKKAKVSHHDKDHDDDSNNREVILSIENSQITTNKPVEEVKSLVIPLIHSENDSRHFAGNAVEAVSLDKLAEQEILAEVSGGNDDLPHYRTNLVIQSTDPSSSFSSSTTHTTTTTTSSDNTVSKDGSNSNKKIPKGSLLKALMDRHKENHQGGNGSGSGGTEGATKLNLATHAPDLDVRSDIYETIPVEEFGAALLRGMGWSGDKKQQSAEEKKLEQRQRRLGLGAAALPGPPSTGNKAIGGKDKKEKKDEKTDKQSQLQKGSIVFIHAETTPKDGQGGGGGERYDDSIRERGEVILSVGVPGLNMIRLSLEKSGKIVDVGRRTVRLVPKDELLQHPFVYAKALEEEEVTAVSVVDVNEYEDDPLQLKQFKQRQEQQQGSTKMKESSTKSKSSSQQQQQQPSYWIRPGLRVKIVSRKLGNNSYLQKGTILDVYKLGVATVRLDGGTILDEVKEKYLETVMPSVGGQCMVLAGEFKGEIGRLLSRDNEQQVAMLELLDSLEVVAKSMDDISAFVNN